MVLCTVHRIAPSNQEPAGPPYPQPFLDDGKFDGKKPSARQQVRRRVVGTASAAWRDRDFGSREHVGEVAESCPNFQL